MRMLEEGAHSVVSVNADAARPENEGKLVHFTGTATGQPLSDPLVGVSADAIHLKRVVAMYQWKETEQTDSRKDTIGGGETKRTTYTYDKVWSTSLIDSTRFRHADAYHNPAQMRVSKQEWTADRVNVGAFMLPPELVSRIDDPTPVGLTESNLASLPSDLKADAKISDGYCFVSGRADHSPDPTAPQIGDIRVAEQVVKPGPVSVIARQTGDTVSAYTTRNGQQLELLHTGAHPADEMIAAEQHKNGVLAWILRGAGFLLMWFGLVLIMQPVATVADVVGFVGSIAGMGIGLVGFLVAGILASLTIAIAWLTYRPLIGVSLLVIAALLAVALIRRRRKSAALRQFPQPA
jgi:hypothetical protein